MPYTYFRLNRQALILSRRSRCDILLLDSTVRLLSQPEGRDEIYLFQLVQTNTQFRQKAKIQYSSNRVHSRTLILAQRPRFHILLLDLTVRLSSQPEGRVAIYLFQLQETNTHLKQKAEIQHSCNRFNSQKFILARRPR